MTETAKQARREYYRRWREQNPERVQAAQERYWLRKAAQRKDEETRAAIVAADPDEQETGLDE